jgi:hypothetical protein
MSEVEEAEVEHVLDFKVEYIFKFDKEKSYKFCVARLDDPIFKNVHGGQLCDVYQVHDIPYEDPTPELTKLRKFVDDRGGKIYAERYDMNAYESHSEHSHPYDIVTIWTSKVAFDKWHFINDHLIDKPSMLNPRHGRRHRHVGCIDSHQYLLHRVNSSSLLPSEIKQNLFSVFKFEFPVDDHVMPRIRSTITHRQDNTIRETEYTLDPPALVDGYSAYGILYIFPPQTPHSIHPALKPFKKEMCDND